MTNTTTINATSKSHNAFDEILLSRDHPEPLRRVGPTKRRAGTPDSLTIEDPEI